MGIKHIHVLTVVLVCTENKLLIIFYVNHHCDIFVSSVDVYSNNSIIGLCLVFYVNVFFFFVKYICCCFCHAIFTIFTIFIISDFEFTRTDFE